MEITLKKRHVKYIAILTLLYCMSYVSRGNIYSSYSCYSVRKDTSDNIKESKDSTDSKKENSIDRSQFPTGTQVLSKSFQETEKDKCNSKYNYGFSLGANFDFLDGVKPNNLYASINVFVPTLFGRCKESVFAWGFEGGLFENRSVSKRDTIIIRNTYTTPYPTNKDTIVQISQTGTRIRENIIDNLGFYACMTLSLYEKKSIGVYLMPLYFEVRRQRTRYNDIDSYTSTNSSIVPVLQGIQSSPPPSTEINFTTWHYSPAANLFLMYNDTAIDWRVKLMPYCIYRADGDITDIAYIYKFNLIEKSAGLEIGGEIRGRYKNPGAEFILFLGKRFCLKKLADFLISGD